MVEILQQPIRNFHFKVFRANTPIKMDHTLCERAWKQCMKLDVRNCVPFCLRPCVPVERCGYMLKRYHCMLLNKWIMCWELLLKLMFTQITSNVMYRLFPYNNGAEKNYLKKLRPLENRFTNVLEFSSLFCLDWTILKPFIQLLKHLIYVCINLTFLSSKASLASYYSVFTNRFTLHSDGP